MDIKTLLFILAISQSIAAIAMLLASRQVGVYEGFRAWTASFVLTAVCMLLISLRGMIPPLLSITITKTEALRELVQLLQAQHPKVHHHNHRPEDS